jgi:DNA-binding transcriptional LysR family regulator
MQEQARRTDDRATRGGVIARSSVPAREGERGLDDLQSMAVFVRVIELGSFTAAARALDTTTSSVSKRVARLEERLGVRLVERTTRSLAPTEAGLAFYDRCSPILREIDEAEDAVRTLGGTPRGRLRVTVGNVIGEAHVAPIVGAFLDEHPGLRMEIDFSDRLVHLIEEGFDVGIRGMRLGMQADSSLIVKRIATVDGVVCGAPSYLAQHGVPETIDDLVDHECLHYGEFPVERQWSFETPEGLRPAPIKSRITMNNISALRAAAIAGTGLIRAPFTLVSEAVRAGQLVCVLERYALTDLGIYAVYPSGRQASPNVRAFIDYLSEVLPKRLETARELALGKPND